MACSGSCLSTHRARSAASLPRDEKATSHRQRAVEILEGLPQIVNALRAGLDQASDGGVRDALMRTLVVNPIRDMIHDRVGRSQGGTPDLRTEIIRTLGRMPDTVSPLMTSLLVDEDVDIRCFAVGLVTALAHPDRQDWLALVIREDRHVAVCTLAVEAMAETGALHGAADLTQLKARFPNETPLHLSIDRVLCRIRPTPEPR